MNVYFPAVVGVPLITPVEALRVSPSGREVPEAMDQVTDVPELASVLRVKL